MDYPPATWRLVVHGEAEGATNMSMDEAILANVVEGASLPTLRLYGWSPPCLSLGRNQPLADVDLGACRDAGVDVVRRPTGGRAILHTEELTYSLALPQTDPRVAEGVLESYRRLSVGLLAGLHGLGVEASQAPEQGKESVDRTAICFETPSGYEITVGARKLMGSAQWRARGGVLQHGTLPLSGDLTRIVNYLAISQGDRVMQRRRLRARALTLADALGHAVGFSQAAEVLANGFAQALCVTLTPGTLSAREHVLAAELRRTRYGASAWTSRT
jgi:lipoate-protein ligase A